MKAALPLIVAVSLAACGQPPGTCVDDCEGLGVEVDQPSHARWRPYIDGRFERVFRPEGTRYVNDHTLVRGPDEQWHLYGITDSSTGNPWAEHSFLHAIAPATSGPWVEQRPDVLAAEDDPGTAQVNEGLELRWAPYVLPFEPGHWVMYFWAHVEVCGCEERIQRADSTDLVNWARDARSAPGGRDPFVLRVGDLWYLYSVGVDAALHGTIILTTSADLEHWSEPVAVLRDPVWMLGWGNLESPFVVAREDGYYLFVTRTGEDPGDYTRTVVFESADPTRFEWAPLTDITAHAAEVIAVDGQQYITSAGWTAAVGEENRGVSMARLGWAPRAEE